MIQLLKWWWRVSVLCGRRHSAENPWMWILPSKIDLLTEMDVSNFVDWQTSRSVRWALREVEIRWDQPLVKKISSILRRRKQQFVVQVLSQWSTVFSRTMASYNLCDLWSSFQKPSAVDGLVNLWISSPLLENLKPLVAAATNWFMKWAKLKWKSNSALCWLHTL